MSKIELVKAFVATADLIVSNGNETVNLAERILKDMANAEKAGMDTETLWFSYAETKGYADKKAGIDGNPMPKTIANYRSISRKAVTLGVGHQFNSLADWKKAINVASKLANSQDEETPQIERINLNEMELPGWIERAQGLRAGMDTENVKAFDAHLHKAIEAFMQKKSK